MTVSSINSVLVNDSTLITQKILAEIEKERQRQIKGRWESDGDKNDKETVIQRRWESHGESRGKMERKKKGEKRVFLEFFLGFFSVPSEIFFSRISCEL